MRNPQTPVLARKEVEAVCAPTVSATGLPGRTYYSEEFYEWERKKLFATGWMGVGFASKLPEVGDAQAVSIAGWELLLVRGSDGSIRCFHNVCRHRGMKVVEGKCSARNLRCPYHSWTYSLEGKLIATPAIAGIRLNESPGIDKQELGLVSVRCEQWFDLLFVNLDGNALPLMEHLQPVIERVNRSFDLSDVTSMPGGRSGEFSYAANWKIVLEGGIEDYHLPYVHRVFSHSADYRTEEGGSIYAGFSARRKRDDAFRRYESEVDGLQLPMMPHMEKSGIAESLNLYIFPNSVISCNAHWIATSLIIPTGPRTTKYMANSNFVRAAADDRYAGLREKTAKYWDEVFGEDAPIWETLQKQAHLREELGIGTRFSPHWERAMHLFQRYVAEKLVLSEGTA